MFLFFDGIYFIYENALKLKQCKNNHMYVSFLYVTASVISLFFPHLKNDVLRQVVISVDLQHLLFKKCIEKMR